MIPKIEYGRDTKKYSPFVYRLLWSAFRQAKKESNLTLNRVMEYTIVKAMDRNQQNLRMEFQKSGFAKKEDVVRALAHLGVQVRKQDGRLFRRRQRPERHIRHMADGKKVLVNPSVLKRKVFPALPPKPMLAEVGPQFIKNPNFLSERKFDGFRAVSIKRGNNVRIYSRSGKEYTSHFPEIVQELRSLKPAILTLDGEIVYLDKNGNDQFLPIQRRVQMQDPSMLHKYVDQYPATYFVFDILETPTEGKKIQGLPLLKRKAYLAAIILPPHLKHVKYTDYTVTPEVKEKLLKQQQALHREGLMHKNINSPYQEGVRSPEWRKHKFTKEADVIVIGWTPGEGKRTGTIGAIHTAMQRAGYKGLWYTGKVGTGFSDEELRNLQRMLEALPQKKEYSTAEIKNLHNKLSGPEIQESNWVIPQVIIEVEYFEMSPDHRFRHGVFKRVRIDKIANVR